MTSPNYRYYGEFYKCDSIGEGIIDWPDAKPGWTYHYEGQVKDEVPYGKGLMYYRDGSVVYSKDWRGSRPYNDHAKRVNKEGFYDHLTYEYGVYKSFKPQPADKSETIERYVFTNPELEKLRDTSLDAKRVTIKLPFHKRLLLLR